VVLVQLVRFLVLELIHSGSNSRFDMVVVFMTNYSFSGNDVLLVTDFVNFKIKSTQSFGGAHRSRVCVHVFIGVSNYTCKNIYIYTVFQKKEY
jgi:hypothetical protein